MVAPAANANNYMGCEWPVDPGCLGDTWDAVEPTVQEYAKALAGQTLRRLTGYRVGGCSTTVRPCRKSCITPYYNAYGPWQPHLNELSQWVNGCGCGDECSCSVTDFINLPLPVGAVYSITLDGVAFTNYVLLGSSLARTDGLPWPVCQNMNQPLTASGTLGITYLNAWPVDHLGQRAAGILAAEYAKACGGGKCRLPANVTSIVRQGVSFDIEGGAFPSGFVGIREVDAYIALWNPNGLRQAPAMWSPKRKFR